MAQAGAVAAIVAQLLEEEAEEEEQVVMALARIAAEEIMELEEGEGFGKYFSFVLINILLFTNLSEDFIVIYDL